MSLTAEWPGNSRQVSSNRGWSAFGAWADALDPRAYRQVVHLWEHGYVRDVAALADQLDGALKHSPPDDHTVHDTAEGLLAAARDAAGADHLAVTNGMGPEDGEDEHDDEAQDYDPTGEGDK